MDAYADHEAKCAKLVAEFAAARSRGAGIGLEKSTSNLFRSRDQRNKSKLPVRQFNRTLHIDRERMIADVEGMTTYETLVDETLKHGLLPAVVPQLKTITVGGAVSGIGIESSSFRFGLVHETVEEIEILLADGRIIVCSSSSNQDLFFGFPNSYGTLGYVLRLKIRLIPAKRYVRLTHTRFSAPEKFFASIAETCAGNAVDYLDGTIFSRNEMYITQGDFTDDAPYVSDYTYMAIYYKSIQRKTEDWLTSKAYIWRWDTDWFWCSKHFGVNLPAIRFLAKPALNSSTYQRLMRLSQKLLPTSKTEESVIQDVDIPIENAVKFFEFLLAEIGITPVWICPFMNSERTYDLYALDSNKLYINFGFWDTIPSAYGEGHFNKKIESRLAGLNGKKALYSTAYYDEETFWEIFNRTRYQELKKKYDPGGVLQDLYAKCVRRK
jgi:FAD/FMN-containing dehydrogenase